MLFLGLEWSGRVWGFSFQGLIFSVMYKETTWWLARWRLGSGYQGTETQKKDTTADDDAVQRGLVSAWNRIGIWKEWRTQGRHHLLSNTEMRIITIVVLLISHIYDSIMNILNVEFTCFNAFLILYWRHHRPSLEFLSPSKNEVLYSLNNFSAITILHLSLCT